MFVLDYFPYHSAKFYDEGANCLKQDYWERLVEHGLTHPKLMVFWGSKILNRVKVQFKEKYAEAAKSGRIAILRGQRAVLKEWNLVFACDPLGERVKAFLK